MRTIRKALVGFLPLLLIGCVRRSVRTRPSAALPTDQFLSTIATMEHSVFPVVCLVPGPNDTATLSSVEGTGFFVSADGTFVTAGHIISGMLGPRMPPEKPCIVDAIYLALNGWASPARRWFAFMAGQCAVIKDFDIARCRTIQAIDVPFQAVEFDYSEQTNGVQVAFTGFPLDVLIPLTARGYVGGYTAPTDLIVDRGNWPGSSGSPIYLANGRVIGILLARGTGGAEGITIARPASFIRGLLPGN